MATTMRPTPERSGRCDCEHAYHAPRTPGLAPVGHARGSEVATLQDVETPTGVMALCAVCRAARHMQEEATR
jgi:hypothetical protein